MSDIPLREVQGVQVPAIGFGTWRLNGDAAYEAVKSALEVGYRHIDTARMYGNEAEVGRALVDVGVPRDEVFLTSKVWFSDASAAAVEREIDASLKALGADHLDLVLLHWPTDEVPLEETLGALERAKAQGKTRLFGVSNFPSPLLHKACEIAPVAINQVELHPFLQMSPMRRTAAELDVLVTAYAPLAKGKAANDPVLRAVGERLGATAAQVALAGLLSLGVVVIPKSSHRERQIANLSAADLTLSDDDKAQIASLDRGLRQTDPAFGPDWAGEV